MKFLLFHYLTPKKKIFVQFVALLMIYTMIQKTFQKMTQKLTIEKLSRLPSFSKTADNKTIKTNSQSFQGTLGGGKKEIFWIIQGIRFEVFPSEHFYSPNINYLGRTNPFYLILIELLFGLISQRARRKSGKSYYVIL